MANFADSFFAGQDAGIAQRQQREAEQKKSALGRLFAQAYSDPNARAQVMPQIAAMDPQFAMSAEGAFGQQQERRQRELSNRAAFLLKMPAEARPVMWQRMAPDAAQIAGIPELATMPWDEATFMPVLQQLAGVEGMKPMNVSPGGAIVDPATGKEIYTNPHFAPKNPRYINVPDGQGGTQLMVDSPEGLTDPRFAGQGGGGGGGGIGALPVLASIADKHGFTVTDGFRTPQQNAATPGSAGNSHHMDGNAIDLSVKGKTPEQIAAIDAEMQGNGFTGGYTERGTAPHLHYEFRGGGRLGHNPPKAQTRTAPQGYEYQPDGTLKFIQGGPADPRNATGNKQKDPTEDQNKAAGWYQSSVNALRNLRSVLKADPSALFPGVIETYGPGDEIKRRSMSANRQRAAQAFNTLRMDFLHAATGAGFSIPEAQLEFETLAPQRGDTGPLVEQKLGQIEVKIEAMRQRAGRALPGVTAADADARLPPMDGSAPKRLRFNPATGELE
jgi:hypothetical protein